jgi:cytochrome c oxidase assembly factor CtaG
VDWSRARLVCFSAGTLLALTALVGPLHELQFELLTAHCCRTWSWRSGRPRCSCSGCRRSSAGAGQVRAPWLGLPLWLVAYYAWHAPPLYDAALRHPDSLLQAEHLTYLIAGAALWLPIVHGTMSDGAKAGYVFAAFVLISPLGLLLALIPRASIPSTTATGA